MSHIRQVPAADWAAWVSETGGRVVDIRQPDEWRLGVLDGAEKISMLEIPEWSRDIDPSTPILLVCRSGSRSQRTAQFLMANGFGEVANLAGGMKALGMQD